MIPFINNLNRAYAGEKPKLEDDADCPAIEAAKTTTHYQMMANRAVCAVVLVNVVRVFPFPK